MLKEPKVLKDHKGPLVHKDLRVVKELKVHKDHKELKVH